MTMRKIMLPIIALAALAACGTAPQRMSESEQACHQHYKPAAAACSVHHYHAAEPALLSKLER